ncbi:MAG: amino acid racemase [Bacteroidetes bacterium]|nr:amino acid racemase [Bacteroidota bacterium]MBU1116984.1 amino acid racemase [Bacteroidota bacterium]MBU1799051.1 amino acid racemase [Bacteroidota bacterium]
MIGIVGGLGPYAGIDLLKKVYDNTIANSDQEHLNTVLVSMPSSINDRTEFLADKTIENPAVAIVEVLLLLEKIGVTFAGIPCNTAHSKEIFDVILTKLKEKKSMLNVLNMITETILFLNTNYPNIVRVGVLSTTGTYKSGIYSEPLKANGYKVILPTIEIQEELIHPAIYDSVFGIKTVSNPINPKAVKNLLQGVAFLKKNGAQAVILGCTEIPLAIPQKEIDGIVMIDATNVLARALINKYSPDKLKGL